MKRFRFYSIDTRTTLTVEADRWEVTDTITGTLRSLAYHTITFYDESRGHLSTHRIMFGQQHMPVEI